MRVFRQQHGQKLSKWLREISTNTGFVERRYLSMLAAPNKGLIVGAANLCTVAFLIGVEEGVRFLPQVFVIVAMIGAAPALGVGAMCGWLGGRLTMLRPLVLVVVPMIAVIAMGVLTETSLIAPAVFPTVIGSLVLEAWTRPNLALVSRPLTPTALGMVIGAINVLVVAIALAIYITRIEPRHIVGGITLQPPFGLHFAALVLCIGVIPGMLVGGFCGFLTTQLRDRTILTRLAGLSSVAVSGVFAIGSLSDTWMLVVPALVPTLVAVAVLERMTRPIEIVPSARVHRTA